jgi:hypothetical protein
MRCSRCGREITPGSLLCDGCGALVQTGQEEAGQPFMPTGSTEPGAGHREPSPAPAAKEAAGPPSGTATSGTAPSGTAPSRTEPSPARGKRSGLPLPPWAWVALACAVACLLFTGLAWPGWLLGGKGALSGPAQVVDSYFKAMEKRDGRAMLDLFPESEVEQAVRLKGMQDRGDLERELDDLLAGNFPRGDLRFSGLEYETEYEGEEALVRVVKGKTTYTDASGERVTETVDSGGNVFISREFRLKLVDGRWFISMGI